MTQPPNPSNNAPIGHPIRVVVADDHAVVRDGVTLQLERHADITVVGTASTGTEVLDLTRRLQPTVLVLDVRMPGTQPIAVVQQVRTLPRPPAVLMLSAFDDIDQVVGLLTAGASGYAVKDEPEQGLVAAVRAVAKGQRWFSPRIAAALVEHTLQGAQLPATPPFSAREREVLQLLGAGKHHQQIAVLLHLSINTVRYHLDNIALKLGLEGRRDVLVWAARHHDDGTDGQP